MLGHRQRSRDCNAARVGRALEVRVVHLVRMIERTIQKRGLVGRKLVAVVNDRRPASASGGGDRFVERFAPGQRGAGDLAADVVQDRDPDFLSDRIRQVALAERGRPFGQCSTFVHRSASPGCGPVIGNPGAKCWPEDEDRGAP